MKSKNLLYFCIFLFGIYLISNVSCQYINNSKTGNQSNSSLEIIKEIKEDLDLNETIELSLCENLSELKKKDINDYNSLISISKKSEINQRNIISIELINMNRNFIRRFEYYLYNTNSNIFTNQLKKYADNIKENKKIILNVKDENINKLYIDDNSDEFIESLKSA